jgi:penicillin-binding protein 2
MKLMYPENRLFRLCLALIALAFLLPTGTSAQSKKQTSNKKTVAKKTEKQAKDAKKDSRNAKSKAVSVKDKKKQQQEAKKREDKKNDAKKQQAKKDDKKDTKKKSAKELAVSKKEAAERKRAEEARRQAILAEQRRREQAAREARARALAFERGLRTETVANIAKDNTEGEDLQIREAAVNALGNRAGTVVVMEAQTGKVLTIVNQDWAVRNSYRPCSTVKLITAVAGINENVINDNGEIRNSNFRMELNHALAFSNNVYFQKVGQGLGPARMYSYGRFLGLGEPTGLNMPGEVGGRLPDTNNSPKIYSHGDDTEVTPVQLAVMVSALSNGGKVVVPQVPRTQFEKANFRGYLKQQIPLPREKYEEVLPGMVGAAEYGTAHRGVDANLGVAGKTGSCIGKGSWLGLFASVAPVENPKYAVVVITRGSGERGKYAAAVAGRVYEALKPRLFDGGTRNIALIPAKLKPKSMIEPASTTARTDADEDEDEDENSNDGDGSSVPAPQVKQVEAPYTKKVKTIVSERPVNPAPPIFKPVIITVRKKIEQE